MRINKCTWLLFVALTACLAVDLHAQSPTGRSRDGRRVPESRGPRGPGGPGPGFMSMLPVMAALDADRDGELSGEEIANASAALKTLDKNEDGKLTFEELRPQLNRGGDDATGNRFGSRGRGPNPEQVVDRWMTMDKNGDQKLTREEVPQRMRTVFARGDANEDGQLDREELTSIAEQRMNRGGREDAGRRNRRTREDGRPQRPQPQEREERRERD